MKIYSLAFSLLFVCPLAWSQMDSMQSLNITRPAAANLVLTSTDGGQTWQDISQGLPENWEGDDFFANENGLYVSAGNRVYHCKSNSKGPFWENETFPGDHRNIAPGKAGMFAYNWNGQFLQKINGTNEWSPKFADFKPGEIRSVSETTGGNLFICTNSRIYKSTNSGKNWKEVYAGGWVIKLVESNGILMATSQNGILRSVNDGENWHTVLSEGGVGIDIAPIKGGFAAINYNTLLMARTVKASYDEGKTWQSIDAGIPPHLNTASIIQVGDDFLCGHPLGIFRSSDKGKTWKLVQPSTTGKVFKLFVSGKVIYAIARNEGC